MAEYTTIAAEAADEFVERRSRFIGAVRPVTTEEEALAFINEKRAAHWDASHNVYAYLLREGQIQRYSDDGEPQGTAGVPVLEVLRKEGLTDIAVVVTRYFGGVLLGAGGLVRAYSHGAKLAVEAAQRLTMCECTELETECGYELYGKVSRLLPVHSAKVLDSDFGALVRLKVLLREEDCGAFTKALTEATAAQAVCKPVGRRWACMNG